MADVRVADRVFAPHYAAPLPREIVVAVELTAERGGPGIAKLAKGAQFEVLELSATHAWGVAPDGAVGYVTLTALAVS